MGSCQPTYPLNAKTSTIHTSPHILAFSSAHSGGAHFLLGDGAVRFISDNIDLTLYGNLASINGGEVLGEF